MKKRKQIRRASALLLILALLTGTVSTGADDNGSDASVTEYSDWVRLDELQKNGEGSDSSSGTRGGDRSGTESSSDLADFLDSIEITGAKKNEAGQYVILDGVRYTVQMFFSEKTAGIQFDEDSDSLTYEFPDGFTPLSTSGRVQMTGTEDEMWLDYIISDGKLTVSFDRTSPGYQTFRTSETAEFEIHTTGVISLEEIQFSDEVTGRFDIDDTREVSVQKTGSYDAALNKIRYTVQAQSRGNNTNVHIGDIITGTALHYDPSSLMVSSNVSNPVEYNEDTWAGETFGLTLPSMSHGETVTIEYYADVDLSLVTGNGTPEQTGNTVKVHGNFNPPNDPEITTDGGNFTNKISISSNSKTASSQTVRGDKTYVTWTIVLNENANISIAGKRVTDTIDGESQSFMRYSGSGIHIEKYRKDGTPAGSDDIRWGTDGLTDGYGGSTWTYTIPASDGENKYRYVITYETEVDSETFLTTTYVGNSVHNDYDTDWGSAGVETTGEEIEVSKSAGDSVVDAVKKEAKTEWEITFNVPAAGLSSAVITDLLPNGQAGDVRLYDEYKDGSVRVKDGDLLEGEGFSAVLNPQLHQVVITFTKNNGESGLTGTGLMRTIHVYLTTVANHHWLVYAETNPQARNHQNTAIVKVNDQYITVDDTVPYNTSQYDLEKEMIGVYTTKDNLPIYLYRVYLKGLDDNAFDQDDCITITDHYDSDHLSFSPRYETYDNNAVNVPNGHVYGSTQHYKESLAAPSEHSVVDEDLLSEGQIVFKLHKNELPRIGDAYYYYYSVVYALQVKDAETLNGMTDEALHSDGLKVGMNNTVSAEKFGTNTIVTDYTLEVLEKTRLTQPGEEYNRETGTYDIQFSISVNKNGLKIGDGDTITVKDTLSNLSFDYTTITVDPHDERDTVNRAGNSVIFTLQNETPYTITYTARVIGINNVEWNNKAELFGRVSGVNGTTHVESGGSGSYDNFWMNVKKYAKGNMNKGLAATFELYEARVKNENGGDIPNPQWEKVGEFTTAEPSGEYAIRTVPPEDSAGRSLRPYSYHDGSGTERFFSENDPLAYGWRYRIVETAAPEGYLKTDTVYEFGISDIPAYSGLEKYNYLNGDTVTIINEPTPPPAEAVISGTKVLRGKELENQEFTFSLSPVENAAAIWGEGYPGGFDGSLTARNNEEGYFSFKLTFTYDDYLKAVQKGLVGQDGRASFYYVVKEEIPEEAEDNIWNGVRYDASQFLVQVKLYVDGDRLKTQIICSPYDGNGVPGLPVHS